MPHPTTPQRTELATVFGTALFDGMRVIESAYATHAGDPVTVRRTLRQRWLSWPWPALNRLPSPRTAGPIPAAPTSFIQRRSTAASQAFLFVH